MHKFSHIEALHQVAHRVRLTNEHPDCPEDKKFRKPVRFAGSVKLHGTNAGVKCTPEGLVAQSRTRVITVDEDNLGFAAFVSDGLRQEAIRAIEAQLRTEMGLARDPGLVLYGEWIGPRIQKGMAINRLPERQFVLFAVAELIEGVRVYRPVVPALGDRFADASIFSIVDVEGFELVIDFERTESLKAAAEKAQAWTEAVEAKCPWGARFGIEGLGEGIVWMPQDEHFGNSDLFFKTKGEKHQKVKRPKAGVQIAPEVLAGIEAFVSFAVTEGRLEQGLEALAEAGHPFEKRSIGAFLKWIGQDVSRECASDLEASGLEWKLVSRAVQAKAKAFFFKRLDEKLGL